MRIAQITDLHLRKNLPGSSPVNSRHSRFMPDLFSEALDRIRHQNVDLLAVTGDLLDVPAHITDPVQGFCTDSPDYWFDAAVEDYKLIKKLLDKSGLKYMVLPGNHDLEKAMWQVFDYNINSIAIAGYHVARFCDREFKHNQPRRFYKERERWLKLLNDPHKPKQIHLQHYVITPSLSKGYPHTYAESHEILKKIVDSGSVQLCLSGHYHRGTDMYMFGKTGFINCSAFCTPPFAWKIYDLNETEITTEDYSLGNEKIAMRKVVFLDRDGVISDLSFFRGGVELMNLVPGAGEAVKRLKNAGFAVVVITNQSCVGAGYIPESILYAVNDKMCRLLLESNAELDGIYCSFSAGVQAVLPEYIHNDFSKPNPAFIYKAKQELRLDLNESWFVGDNISDIKTGIAADLHPVLVKTGDGSSAAKECKTLFPDVNIAADLPAAVNLILDKDG